MSDFKLRRSRADLPSITVDGVVDQVLDLNTIGDNMILRVNYSLIVVHGSVEIDITGYNSAGFPGITHWLHRNVTEVGEQVVYFEKRHMIGRSLMAINCAITPPGGGEWLFGPPYIVGLKYTPTPPSGRL